MRESWTRLEQGHSGAYEQLHRTHILISMFDKPAVYRMFSSIDDMNIILEGVGTKY